MARSIAPPPVVSVRVARPAGRPFQVRYTDPATNKEIRVSVGSRDDDEAEILRRQIEAKLTLGQPVKARRVSGGPSMSWDEFREAYSTIKLATLRGTTASSTENRLDVCERIVKPNWLADMVIPERIERLKLALLRGDGAKRATPRSAHTVNSYLAALVAAINWAVDQKWLPARLNRQVVAADDPDKGRPLTDEEFDELLVACVTACPVWAESWQYLLRGLWESGLRVSEAMALSFDMPGTIQVVRGSRGVVLQLPGAKQKNRKTQTIPTIPSFMSLLDEHPTGTGWVFDPSKQRGEGRMATGRVAQTIASIGEASGIVVNAAGKFASAHDLRRSFGQRLADAGVSPRDLQKIMRHRSITTTEQYYLRDDALDIGERIATRFSPAGVTGKQR